MTAGGELRRRLDVLYRETNRREQVHPDPLEFLYEYESHEDREIVALVASSLAFGRVAQILAVVRSVLALMGSPRAFVDGAREAAVRRTFSRFKYRFVTGVEIAALFTSAREVIQRHGSIGAAVRAGHDARDETLHPALSALASGLREGSAAKTGFLIPDPGKGSALKRRNLMARWMVRRDAVDPGGWNDLPAAKLVVPLDVHMWRVGRSLGFTSRSSPDLRAALQITRGFRDVNPGDPVKYDFTLTRIGMRGENLRALGLERLED
jgi:uncharacterized protein (TIGR02757 family)